MVSKIWDSVPPRGKTRFFSSYESVPHGYAFHVAIKRLDADDMDLPELLLGVIIQVMSYCDDENIDFDDLVEQAEEIPKENLYENEEEEND